MSCTFRFNLASQLLLAYAMILSFSYAQAADVSQIKSDEHVVFFPTFSRSEDHQSWLVPIHGWIFEKEKGDVLRDATASKIRDMLGLQPDDPSTRIFNERIRSFLVDNERGKRIGIQMAGENHVLGASGADGHFTGTIRLPNAVAERFIRNGVLRYEATTSPTDQREFRGISHCLKPEGISVISDVDDTIKITEVLDKKNLIRNTLFREFRAVDGMPAIYSSWAKSSAQFHYVSAGPWQLYEPLAVFMSEAGFPSGAVRLRKVRLKDSSFLRLFANPLNYKLSEIEPILKAFPKRKFILVGDSGEKDPEVYGIVARRYASQVKQIYIRDVTGEAAHGPRYQNAFRGLTTDAWQLFRDSKQLPKNIAD